MNQRFLGFADEYRSVIFADSTSLKIIKGQIAFLASLFNSSDYTATIDDATSDLDSPFCDGGKWRGSITLGLAKEGLIASLGAARSNRPSRRRGLLHRWRLVEPDKAKAKLKHLQEELKEKTPKSAATDQGRKSKDSQGSNDSVPNAAKGKQS